MDNETAQRATGAFHVPIEYRLDQDGAVVLAQAHGALTLDCFMLLQRELCDDNGLQDVHDTLLDLRFVTDIQLTESDLSKIAQALSIGRKQLGARKLAIVARSEQSFSLGSKYGETKKDVPENVIMFVHMEVARRWLGVNSPQ
jgi:hypothetical protein